MKMFRKKFCAMVSVFTNNKLALKCFTCQTNFRLDRFVHDYLPSFIARMSHSKQASLFRSVEAACHFINLTSF